MRERKRDECCEFACLYSSIHILSKHCFSSLLICKIKVKNQLDIFSPIIKNLAFLRGLLASDIKVKDIVDYLECSGNTGTWWKNKMYANPNLFLMDSRVFNSG